MKKHMTHPSLHAYEFMELTPCRTYVYALQRDNKVYITDTSYGSTFADIIEADYPGKSFVMISTHYYFDHIQGNYSFLRCPIYVHQLCKTMIQRHGIGELQEQEKYFQGTRTLVLPNHYFDGKQLQMAGDLQLLYTPGYTLGGISVYNQTLNALSVGDILKKPSVQIEGSSPSEYGQTLEHFLTLPVTHSYTEHASQLTKIDVRDTLAYIHALSGDEAMQSDSEETQRIHSMNLNARKQ